MRSICLSARFVALTFACLVSGAVMLLTVLVVWPSVYFEVADRFRWRLHLPKVGQIKLEATLVQVQLRGDPLVGNNATLLFGDSHLHGLPTSVLGETVTNYAIAGEPASRLAERIGRYPSLSKVRKVVLFSGSNDLAAGVSPLAAADAVASAMQQVPAGTPVILVEVPPSRSSQERQAIALAFNSELARRCALRPGCRLLPLSVLADQQGRLHPDYSSSDGIHLSIAGYQVLAQALSASLHHSN